MVVKYTKEWYHLHPEVYVSARGKHNIKLQIKGLCRDAERGKTVLASLDMQDAVRRWGRVGAF